MPTHRVCPCVQTMTTVAFCLLFSCLFFYCVSSRSTVWYHCLSHISTLMSLSVNLFSVFSPLKSTTGQVLSSGDLLLFLCYSVCLLLPCLSYPPTLASENGTAADYLSSSTLFLPSFSLLFSLFSS